MRAKSAALALLILSMSACTVKRGPEMPPVVMEPDTKERAEIATVPISPLLAVQVSPNGEWAAASLDGLTLAGRAGQTHRPYRGGDPIRFLSWSSTGARLLAVTKGGKLLLTSPGEAAAVDLSDRVTGLGEGPVHAAWSPDGNDLLVTSGHHRAPLWRITPATGEVIKLQDLTKPEEILWLTDGQVLIRLGAGCCEAQRMLLDLAAGTLAEDGTAASVAVSPDGRRIASTRAMNGELTVTDRAQKRTVTSGRDFYLMGPRPPVEIQGQYRYTALSWSPNSRFLAFALAPAGSTPMLRVYDFAWLSNNQSRLEQVIPNWAGQHAWLGADELLYTTQEGGALKVHLGGAELSSHPGATAVSILGGAPLAVRSPDGRKLAYAVVYPDATTVLVTTDLTTGKVTHTPRSKSGMAPLTWSPEAGRLVIGKAVFTTDSLSGGGQVSYWRLQELTTVTAGDSGAQRGAALEPFWGPPGTVVRSDSQEGQLLSQTFAPVTMGGRTFTPVYTGEGTFLMRREGDRVYLDGRVTNAGTMELWKEPRHLFTLPLTTGVTFDLQQEHHNFGIGPFAVKVVGFEAVETPAGRFETVVLENQYGGRSWWAPGVGRVKAGESIRAAAVERVTPRTLGAITRLDATTTGILTGGFQVIDQAGRVLLDHPINFLRSSVRWVNVGAPAPLIVYTTHTQAEPNLTSRAFTYHPAEKRFTPVRWRLPDGRLKEQVAGSLEVLPEQLSVRLDDDEHYPRGTACVFRWNGAELACASYLEGSVARGDLGDGIAKAPPSKWGRLPRYPDTRVTTERSSCSRTW